MFCFLGLVLVAHVYLACKNSSSCTIMISALLCMCITRQKYKMLCINVGVLFVSIREFIEYLIFSCITDTVQMLINSRTDK